MLAEILELFGFGIAVHDTGGPLVYANQAARRHLGDALIAGTIRAARLQPGRGAVDAHEGLQVCSVSTGPVVVTIITTADAANVDAAARLFELTPTEERVAAMLVDGATARQISTLLDVSLHTVQSHFKSLLAKTQSCSQNELIARLRGATAFLALRDFFRTPPAIKGCANNSLYLISTARVQKNNRGESL